jgi:hypothetical protein
LLTSLIGEVEENKFTAGQNLKAQTDIINERIDNLIKENE